MVAAPPAGIAVQGVNVVLFDSSNHRIGSAQTVGNGTYTVSGLAPSKTGYTVCFHSTAATTHYAGQCYQNAAWMTSRLPPPKTTPVPVIAGIPTIGINAALKK